MMANCYTGKKKNSGTNFEDHKDEGKQSENVIKTVMIMEVLGPLGLLLLLLMTRW